MSLVYFLIVLGILVMVHEFGHFIVAKRLGVRVDKFSIGFGPKLWSIKRGGTEYIVSSIPLGGYVKMAGDEPGEKLHHKSWEFLSRSVGDRFKIIIAGPALNYALAFLIFSFVFMIGSPTLTAEVGGLLKGYPAENAGIMKGDRIIAVDGKGVKYWEEMTELIHKHVTGPVRLTIDRKGERVEKEITPVVRKTRDIFGKEIEIALVGIAPSQGSIEKVRYGPLGSVRAGFNKLIQLTVVTYKALWSIVTGRLSVKESMAGPIGIFIITGEAAKLGLVYVLHLMAILSASLAIFNVLPLPVLDGGHIFFLAVEKLRGRQLPVKVQEAIANVGVAVLVALSLFIIYSDMVKFGIFDNIIKLTKR